MGNKPSNIFQMDRPESGGADRDEERESSGLLDRAKEEFAEAQRQKDAGGNLPARGRAREASRTSERSAKALKANRGKERKR